MGKFCANVFTFTGSFLYYLESTCTKVQFAHVSPQCLLSNTTLQTLLAFFVNSFIVEFSHINIFFHTAVECSCSYCITFNSIVSSFSGNPEYLYALLLTSNDIPSSLLSEIYLGASGSNLTPKGKIII